MSAHSSPCCCAKKVGGFVVYAGFFLSRLEENFGINCIRKSLDGLIFNQKLEATKEELNVTKLTCPYNLFLLPVFRHRRKPCKSTYVTANATSFGKGQEEIVLRIISISHPPLDIEAKKNKTKIFNI